VAIPQSFIQELVTRADVVEIVGRYVQLKKTGANFSGLCPFHAEKSPSFTVSPTKQFYHCFGCGKNGNAIGFLMDHTGMGFIDAVKDLAGQYGMQVPEEDISPEQRARATEQRQKQTTLTEVLQKAAEAYRKHLKDANRAIDYCKQRGLSGEIARRFGLGYAPQGWRSLASVFPRYDDPLLVESGLVIQGQDEEPGGEEKRYDRFRDRLMFPIRNVKGECIGFGGRVLGDEKPKYLNSPETPVFHKGRELYGLFEARTALREQGFVLVTEGYMDVVALAQLGFPNAVATLGTACTADHVQKMFRFTDAVVFSFDGDAAGRRAARKALDAALPHASDVRNVKFLFLPPEHDPDSFIRAYGKEAFARCISEAVPLSQFLVDAARDGCELLTAEGRALMASHARPLWSLLPDGALKRQLLGEIATLVQLPTQELTALWTPANPVLPRGRYPTSRNEAAGATGQMGTRWRQTPTRPRWTGRVPPASRADHAARILLGHMEAWNLFSAEDHAMLCQLPAPHGPLFVWLEHELHERGPQPWGAAREGLREHACEALALRVMADQQLASVEDPHDTVQELRNLLRRMLVEHLKSQETLAIQVAAADPCALLRYREIQARRLALEAEGG